MPSTKKNPHAGELEFSNIVVLYCLGEGCMTIHFTGEGLTPVKWWGHFMTIVCCNLFEGILSKWGDGV